MEQAEVSAYAGRPGPAPFGKSDERLLPVVRRELRSICSARNDVKPENLLVELEGPRQIGNLEANGSHASRVRHPMAAGVNSVRVRRVRALVSGRAAHGSSPIAA